MFVGSTPIDHPMYDELVELRIDSLRWIASGAIVVAFAYLCIAVTVAFGDPRVVVVPGLLVAVGAATLALVRYTLVGASTTLLVGLGCTAIVSAVIYHTQHPLYTLPILILIAPLVLRYSGAVVGAAATGLLVLLLAEAGTIPLSRTDGLAIVGMIAASSGLAWIAYRPTWTMLHWAWESYLAEHRRTEEARERQAQLAKLSKSLAEACERLEHVNRELDRARQAADEARRLKAEFAATISHELRTPLNLIVGFSEMMIRSPHAYGGGVLPELYRRDLEVIHENATQLSRLADDVLDLSQIEAHRMALDRRPTVLRDVVDEAVAVVRALFDHAGLTLSIEVPPDLPMLNVDPTRVRQILINLLANAVRHTDRGGVVVRASAVERDVVVAVADTGVGIPADELPRVFREFQQASTRDRRGTGSGLGLTICQRFVELHGGSMWVESELGRGSVFYLSLPRIEVGSIVGTATTIRVTPRPVGQRCVVVFDNGTETPRIFRRYLDGYRVFQAGSVRALRKIAAARPVHAIIVADSPTARGIREFWQVHPSLSDVPVFACSFESPKLVADEQGLTCLTKPISHERLADVLRSIDKDSCDVLVVDDDVDMVRLLSNMVGDASDRCRIRTAGDGVEALAAIRAARPDLVLLDLQMPGLDGEGVLRALRADPRLRDVRVVVITGKVSVEHVLRAQAVRLSRPNGLTVGEIVKCVQSSLDALFGPALAEVSADRAMPVVVS